MVDGECTSSDPDMTMIVSEPKPGGTVVISRPSQVILYNLHRDDIGASSPIGSSITSLNGVCPTFCAEKSVICF